MDEPIGTGASLADDQRPRTFQDIIGHVDAVQILKQEIEARSGRSVLLHGPMGCGKTTLAEVYAKGVLCDNAEERPCSRLACRSCDLFEAGRTPRLNFVDHGGHPNYRRVICRDKHDSEAIAVLDQDVFTQSISGGRKVFLIEDLHRLSSQGFDDLHHRLERLPSHVTFIMCTSDLSAVPLRVQTLCPNPVVEPLTVPDRVRLLASTCDAQDIPYEHDALTLIAELSATDTRSPIRDLQVLLTWGSISLQNTMRFYKTDAISPAEAYLQAVLDRSDVEYQIEIMKAWVAEPHVKIQCIENYIAFLMTTHVARIKSYSVLGFIKSARAEARIIEQIARRTAASTTSEVQYWATLAHHWRAGTAATEASLRVMILGFDDLINGHHHEKRGKEQRDNGRAGLRRPRTGQPIAILEKARVSPRRSDGYLALPKVLALWESASFMVQVHGVLLNSYFRINHTQLGTQNDVAGIISDLTHELRPLLRPMSSNGKRTQLKVPLNTQKNSFHWLYINELSSDKELITHLVAHVPHNADDVESWSRHFLERRIGSNVTDDGLRVRRGIRNREHEILLHHRLLRRLCRSVDPNLRVWLNDGNTRSQHSWVDLLAIDRRMRGFAGFIPGLKPCGWAQTIGLNAQKKAKKERFAALSIIEAGTVDAWEKQNRGWELVEHENRTVELAERHAEEQILIAKWPPGPQREVHLAGLRSRWHVDSLMRQRHKTGWWTSLRKRS